MANNIFRLPSSPYIIELDSLDIMNMPLWRFSSNDASAPIPLFSRSSDIEYYNIQIFADKFDDCHSNEYKCQLCNLVVLKQHVLKHNTSKRHMTNEKIAEYVVDRANKYKIIDKTFNTGRMFETLEAYCDICNMVVDSLTEHSKTDIHKDNLKVDEITVNYLATLTGQTNLKIDNSKEKFDTKTGLQSNQEYIDFIINSHPDIGFRLEVSDDAHIKIQLGANCFKVPMERFHGFAMNQDKILCRVCRVLVLDNDIEKHKRLSSHISKIMVPIDKHCVRMMDASWRHCIPCNDIIDHSDFHVCYCEEHKSNINDFTIKADKHNTDESNTKINENFITNVKNNAELGENIKPLYECVVVGCKEEQVRIQKNNNNIDTNVNYSDIKENESYFHTDTKIVDTAHKIDVQLVNNVKVVYNQSKEINNKDVMNTADETIHKDADENTVESDNMIIQSEKDEITEDKVNLIPDIESTTANTSDDYPLFTIISKKRISCNICSIIIHINDKKKHLNGTHHKRNVIDKERRESVEHYSLMPVNENTVNCKICNVNVINVSINIHRHINSIVHKEKYANYLEGNAIERRDDCYFCKKCNVTLEGGEEFLHCVESDHAQYLLASQLCSLLVKAFTRT